MDPKFLSPYKHEETEGRINKLWLDSGYFNPDNLPQKDGRPFTIVMPPPNANGNLHAGHVLFITLEDIMTRYKRMCGYRALWIPGADHAGGIPGGGRSDRSAGKRRNGTADQSDCAGQVLGHPGGRRHRR